MLGPGRTPEQCVARLRPWFDEHEPAMTQIAERLATDPRLKAVYGDFLADGNVSSIRVERPDELKIDTNDVVPSAEEIDYFLHRWKSMEGSFFTPTKFDVLEADETSGEPIRVRAWTIFLCGSTRPSWIFRILGLPPALGNDGVKRDHPFYPGAMLIYVYWPGGLPQDELSCDSAMFRETGFAFCDIALTDEWMWHTEVLPDDFLDDPERYLGPKEELD